MKVILKNAIIFGYDPSKNSPYSKEKISKNGKSYMTYGLKIQITDTDKKIIDSYLYDKVSQTETGELLFWCNKMFEPIPLFDENGKILTEPINGIFLADVSINIDEKEYNGDTTRFSECKGIKYLRMYSEPVNQNLLNKNREENFNDIFGDSETLVIEQPNPYLQEPVAAQQPIVNNDPLNMNAPVDGVGDSGLPF